MKKLMVAVIAGFLGISANAAAVTWAATNIQSSPDSAVAAGWFVQLFDSSVTYDYEAAISGDITARFNSSTIAGTGTSFKINEKASDAAAANEVVSLYMVIYDNADISKAKNYIVSDVSSKTVNAAGSDITISFGSMTGTTTANKFLNSSWSAVPSESVPEPTSGLLLLLGMAGLALRRKQA
jgi:hypothetical protein